MYWVKNGDNYEVLDGQQRTISICQYVNGHFQINAMARNNLTNDQQEQILNCKLMVYFCEGTNSEKLDWFRVVNIAGENCITTTAKRNTIPRKWKKKLND
jgi:hypothetical protein